MNRQPVHINISEKIPVPAMLQIRLLFFFVLLALIPLVVQSWISLSRFTTELRHSEFEELRNMRDQKAGQIQQFFDRITQDVQIMAASPLNIQAVQDLTVENLFEVRLLGYLNNPFMVTSGRDTPYDRAHARYHPYYQRLMETGRYTNLYLINGEGDVVYSYAKGSDFATNLLTGPYKDSPLSELFQRLKDSTSVRVETSNFILHFPNGGETVMFIGAPLLEREGEPPAGVLVVQVPGSLLDRLVQENTEILGETGEVYLVGPDNLMRTNSRFSTLDTAFRQIIRNNVIEGALKGAFGYTEMTGYRGYRTMVAYQPIKIGHQTWALVVEAAVEEVMEPTGQVLQTTLLFSGFTLLLVAITAFFIARRITLPLSNLTETALAIASGDFERTAEVQSGDEVGMLAVAINTMTNRLRSMIESLEEHVRERTQQLETVMEISQNLSEILDLSDLLRRVVTVVKERFKYYHVHIYLLDKDHEILVMAEGYGKVGQELKRRAHHIPLNALRSLVARAARERQAVVVNDVRTHPDWLPNPLLPDTLSEAAVPIMTGTEVVGILDVQSAIVNGISEDELAALQALANQLGVAVRNARLFAETQEALYEARRLQRLYTGQAWEEFRTGHPAAYEFRDPTLPPLEQVDTPEAVLAYQQQRLVRFTASAAVPDNGQPLAEENGHEQQTPPALPAGDESGAPAEETGPLPLQALAVPLKLRDEIIGILGIHDVDPNRVWTDQELALIEDVCEQMAVAIENARLFEQTQRDVWRSQLIGETVRQLWASNDLQEVMKVATSRLAEQLQASEVVITLGTDEDLVQENSQ